jgi:hypothetical protein
MVISAGSRESPLTNLHNTFLMSSLIKLIKQTTKIEHAGQQSFDLREYLLPIINKHLLTHPL